MPLEVGNGDCGEGDAGKIRVDDDGREPLARGTPTVGRVRVNRTMADDVVRSILRERPTISHDGYKSEWSGMATKQFFYSVFFGISVMILFDVSIFSILRFFSPYAARCS